MVTSSQQSPCLHCPNTGIPSLTAHTSLYVHSGITHSPCAHMGIISLNHHPRSSWTLQEGEGHFPQSSNKQFLLTLISVLKHSLPGKRLKLISCFNNYSESESIPRGRWDYLLLSAMGYKEEGRLLCFELEHCPQKFTQKRFDKLIVMGGAGHLYLGLGMRESRRKSGVTVDIPSKRVEKFIFFGF